MPNVIRPPKRRTRPARLPAVPLSRREQEIERRQRERESAIAGGRWFQRAAEVMTDQVDAAGRSIPAVVATETPVPMYDRATGRIVDEVLIASGGQLPEWAPMLRSHETWDITHSVLGSVLSARRSGQQVEAMLRFASSVGDSDDVERVWTRVRDGHLRAVSVGGRRLIFTDIEPGQSATIAGRRWVAGGKRPLRITTRWVMREASIVIFGADGSAGTQA